MDQDSCQCPRNEPTAPTPIPQEAKEVPNESDGDCNTQQNPSDNLRLPSRWFSPERVQAIFTFLLFLTTSLYTYFSYQQWRSMRQTLEYAERPWLILTTIETTPLTAHTPILVRYVLTNSGHTPAYILEESFTLSVSDKIIPPDPRISIKPKTPSAITVPPNRNHHGNTDPSTLSLPSETIDLISRGERFFHVYGYITYRDVFEKIHTSLFCATYAPQNRPPYSLFQFSKQPSCQYAD
jgi:hypothetical protein